VNGTNNYYNFNATLTIYINETTTVCNVSTIPTATVVNPVFDVNSTCTSTAIPECHNTWDIILIVLIIFFGLLALLALIALGCVLLRRYAMLATVVTDQVTVLWIRFRHCPCL
jgi:type IV secretory pathway TrbL component